MAQTQAETLEETLNKAIANGGLSVSTKGHGSCRLHTGTVTNVVVGACWAYFTHEGYKFRTDTQADKEKLLAGDLSVTWVRIGAAPQAPVEEAEELPRVRGFIPRSRRLGIGDTVQII